jgi:hypothetical protein
MGRLRACVALALVMSTTACAGEWMPATQPAPRVMANGPSRHVRLHLVGDSTVEMRHAVLVGDSAVMDARPAPGAPARAIPLAQITWVDEWESGTGRTISVVLLGTVGVVGALFAILLQGID